MTRLKSVGFFRELSHGDPDGPALKDVVRSEPANFERNAIAYLSSAVQVATAPMLVNDVLAPSVSLGAPGLMTDGTWIWPSDLSYYVQKYHCELPPEFIDHMRLRNWRPPAKQELDVDAIQAYVENNSEIIEMVEKIDG